MAQNNNTSNNIIAVCVTVIVCFTLAAAVGVFIAVPDGANTGSLIAIIMASLPGNIVGITALVKANSIKEDTGAILNGRMEAKIESVMKTVLAEDKRNGVTES